MDTPTSRTRRARAFSAPGTSHRLGGPPDRSRLVLGLATLLGVFTAVSWAPSLASGQDWAVKMFDHTSKDLGVVARGAKVEHVFTLENIYVEDVHVVSIGSSCGCTIPTIEKNLLKTYEKTRIVAVVDTRNFVGRKQATLTVVFDKPFPAEVRLNLHCFIRGDVVFQPGSVQFGSVPQGASAQRKVVVSYAGRSDWRIVRVDSDNPHLEAVATPVGRATSPTNGATQVTYDLVVKLKSDAPSGYIRSHLHIVTDDADPHSARVPLTVEGMVMPAMLVKPSPLMLGSVAAGKSVVKSLVVQGKKPFNVLGVSCSDPRFKFTLPAGAKKVHLIPVKFTADDQSGSVSTVIRIETDVPEGKLLEVKAGAQVLP